MSEVSETNGAKQKLSHVKYDAQGRVEEIEEFKNNIVLRKTNFKYEGDKKIKTTYSYAEGEASWIVETLENNRIARLEKHNLTKGLVSTDVYYYDFKKSGIVREANSPSLKNHYIDIRTVSASLTEELEWNGDDSLPYSLKRVWTDADLFHVKEAVFILNFPYQGDTIPEYKVKRRKTASTIFAEEFFYDTWKERLSYKVRSEINSSGNMLYQETKDPDGNIISSFRRSMIYRNGLPYLYETTDELGQNREVTIVVQTAAN